MLQIRVRALLPIYSVISILIVAANGMAIAVFTRKVTQLLTVKTLDQT